MAMLQKIEEFVRNEDGSPSVEYSMVAMLIAVAIISSMVSVSSNLTLTWGNVATATNK